MKMSHVQHARFVHAFLLFKFTFTITDIADVEPRAAVSFVRIKEVKMCKQLHLKKTN